MVTSRTCLSQAGLLGSIPGLPIDKRIEGGNATPFGLIVCDVNGLERINDTLGHKAGDEYIRSACAMLRECYAHSPVFRVGGDAFTVVPEGRDHEGREETLRDINAKIEEDLGSGKVVASSGMAIYEPGADHSFHEVFKRENGMMHARKTRLKGMGAVPRDRSP